MNAHEPQESIAIVGMAGRFPQAKNLEEFWRNLREGRECISFFQDEPVQWLPIEHPPRPDDPRYVRARGVLERPEWFDAAFFGMNPKEAEMMDPQHRVFLECAWEALEDAGCNPETYDGLIGVFAGASLNTYLLTNLMTNRDLIADFGMFSSLIMNDGDFVPTRVSYKFNLRGPSINVQTACSTSLVAVALAAQNLLGYRCDVALAGGVSITFPRHRGQFHLEGGILSKDGHCRTFDAQASGTVLGDGAGVVVLKRLSDALADGDRICAVIKGTAINNDGSVKIGYTAPSVDGQAEVIAMAQAEAGFAPETVSYIEAHGTGTPLGDPIEIAGLTKAFGLDGRRGQFCAVGSVKSNLGHLDIGAGVAGLIKTVLALQHGEIPPSLHFEKPNPKIDLQHSPFFVNSTLRPWPRNGTPRRAGVSSFGIGGTNAHVAVEEAPALEPTGKSRSRQLLVLSAKTPTALDAMTENLAAHLELSATAKLNLADVAYTLQTGRKVFGRRRALVVESAADAVQALRAKEAKRVVTGGADETAGTVAFMFPGQGAQAVNMAREIYETEPEFRATVDRCSELLRPKLGLDLREVIFPGVGRGRPTPPSSENRNAAGSGDPALQLQQTSITQPAMFVIEYALAQLWMGWGIKPAAMIGHSLGEYVAATIAGVFTLEDALALVAERARLMQAQPAGAMVAIRQPEPQVAALLDKNLALAAVNAPGLCVVSGPFDAVEAAEKRLTASAIPFKRLATSHAFHSAMMEPALPPLAALVRKLKLNAPKIPWVSNVTGKWITPEQATSADYWATHLRQTVRFADGLGELIKAGHRVLLEVGPGQTLAGLARQHPATAGKPAAAGGAATIVATLGRASEGADVTAVLHALGELWVAGVTPDWRGGFYRGEQRRIVSLPTYPFERKRYWIEPGVTFALGGQNATSATRVDGDLRAPSTSTAVDANAPAHSTSPGPRACREGGRVAPQAPSTLTTLRSLFQDLSGIDLTAAGADETFYQLGFDSLFLTQASLAVSRKFGVEITFRQLREDLPSLQKLAAHLDTRATQVAPPAPLRDVLAVDAGAEKRIPLTDAQREMWFASQLGPAVSTAYNESSTLRLKGPVDAEALHRALRQLVARHEALRTTFAAAGDLQVIAPTANIELPLHDYSSESAGTRETRASACVEQEVQRTFDLVNGPLFRATLVRVEPQAHLLLLVVHHIICDGWSLGILMRELGELYSAEVSHRAAALAPAPRFSEYAEKQAAARNTAAFAAAEAFWKNQFADAVPGLDLPTDRPRSATRTYAGGFLLTTLSPEVTRAVKKLCADRDCTAFTALLAAFNVLLHRLTGQDDLVVGVPSAAQVMDGLENLIGHFANLLPIRSRIGAEQPFAAYLDALRRDMTTALEHWRYPFSTLLQQLNLPRDASRVPLAPVVFNTTRRRGVLNFAGLQAEVAGNPKRFVNFDLNFNFALTDDTISLGCYYSTELFDEDTIARWFGHFETLLRGIAANPDQRVVDLPLLTAAQRQQLLVEWNDTAVDYRRDATICQLFAEQVQRTPNAVAVVAGRERVGYAELNRRADNVAHRLMSAGVRRDVPVGLFLERNADLPAAMLGVLKAGGAYVPMDPAHPVQRLAFVVEDTRMPVIITQRSLARYLPATSVQVVLIDEMAGTGVPFAPAASSAAQATDLAYIIYTSGSTGQPKGVCVMHRGVVALTAWAQKFYRPEELAGVLFATSATFDVSVFESLVPLCLGGKIIIAENILQVASLPAVDELTLISGVPSAVAELVRARKLPARVRTVNVAGEPCPQALVEALYELPHVDRVVDVYGPTETTVYSTGSVRSRGGRATIGRPLPNEQVYILDAQQQPVPIGVRGELYIGGDKLARGYLNRAELTQEKFVEISAAPGAKVYRTGDGARYRPDGNIEFLGRLDYQVKIRGYRIELGEIEAVLAAHPGVAETVTVVRPEPSGTGHRILAFVVRAPDAAVTERELRDHLVARLPDYMVPAALVILPELPRTTSGKIDRRALPEPEFSAVSRPHEPPRNTTEELLVEVWCDVLGLKSVGIHDNFFELGGHSLLATQVIARIHDSLGVELSMRQFFVAPTVAGMAPAIEAALIEEIKSIAEESAAPAQLLATAKE